MKTVDFLRKNNACSDVAKWALSVSDNMADVWNSLIQEGKYEWLLWAATRPGVFPAPTLCRLACLFVRETVWDRLTDERSRRAIEVAERYADGLASEAELDSACADARTAGACIPATEWAFYEAAAAAEAASACDLANAAAYCAANYDDIRSAQIRVIADIGNPFGKDA